MSSENETVVAETTDSAAEKQAEAEGQKKHKKKKKRERRRERIKDLSLQRVIGWFSACGRCGSFLTGYKLAVGEDALTEAIMESGSRWLPLAWHDDIPELLLKSYGSRVDIGCYHYEGCCAECRRRFVYHVAASDPARSFRIELKSQVK